MEINYLNIIDVDVNSTFISNNILYNTNIWGNLIIYPKANLIVKFMHPDIADNIRIILKDKEWK